MHRYSKLQCNIFSISAIYYLYIPDTSSAWKFFTDNYTAAPFQSSYIHVARILHIQLVSLGCESEILYVAMHCPCIFQLHAFFECPSANAPHLPLIFAEKFPHYLIESLAIILFKKIYLGYSCVMFASLYKTCSLGVLTALFHETLPRKRNDVCLGYHRKLNQDISHE